MTATPPAQPRRSFSVNAHGVALYMANTPYAQRRIVESYAFPDEDKAKIITPVPAKGIVYDYFHSGRNPEVLTDAIAQYSVVPPNESAFGRGRRRSAVAVAKHLQKLGPKLDFRQVRKATYSGTIDGLTVRTSLDFVGTLSDGRHIGAIFNVSQDLSDKPDQLKQNALVETEITWQLSRGADHELAEIWYVDVGSEKIVRKHAKSSPRAWQNIRTVCDNILIAYDALIRRRGGVP